MRKRSGGKKASHQANCAAYRPAWSMGTEGAGQPPTALTSLSTKCLHAANCIVNLHRKQSPHVLRLDAGTCIISEACLRDKQMGDGAVKLYHQSEVVCVLETDTQCASHSSLRTSNSMHEQHCARSCNIGSQSASVLQKQHGIG
jgi:hypothetical protein